MLYFSEPYLQQIRTNVVDQKQDERGNWFAFQQTIFYPQGGGQSADHGWINGCEVRDVQKDGETVWHLLTEKLAPDVEMKIDWNNRYDNMRQHSGQHVLSASFSRLFNLETVSVHLGSENTLIELNTPGITPEQLQAAEEHANGVVAQNLAVQQMWIYRITGTEKIRRHIRVHSKIGRPAYAYYSKLNEQVQRLCTLLSMEIDDLPARVQTMLDEQRELNRQLKTVTEKWLMAYAAELRSGGPCGFFMIADLAAEQTNKLCGFWLARNNKPCLIASGGPLRQLNFTMRSPTGHKQNVLGFLQKHGQEFSLKGGGSAEFVQGVINQTDSDAAYSARLQKQFEDYFTKQE